MIYIQVPGENPFATLCLLRFLRPPVPKTIALGGVPTGIMKAALEERKIPHAVRSFHDSAYDGLYQMQSGWGAVEADEEHRAAIEEIYAEVLRPRGPG